MDSEDDYYAILELHRGATDAEVKKAYRRMALRWHPDKNQSNQAEAESRFKLVSEAYEVLSDPEKRRVYDQFGKAGLAEAEREGFADMEGGYDHYPHHHHQHAQYHFRDPRDVFRDFFGPGDPFTRIFYNPDPLRSFEESMRNMGDQHRASNNIGRDFGGDFFSDFMSSAFASGPLGASSRQSRISVNPGGTSQPLHSVHVSRTFTKTTADGRRVVVRKVTENGVETVTESVNGRVTSQTVNGHPVSLTDDWKFLTTK